MAGQVTMRMPRGGCPSWLCWWLCLCLWLPACAQASVGTSAPAPAFQVPVSLRLSHLGIEQGLPQQTVYAITQDLDSYLWFGTQSGLGRYDGYAFSAFSNDPDDPDSLGDNWIQALHTDARGRLWVGHRRGLDRYDPVGNRFVHHHPPGLGRNATGDGVNALAEDAAGKLWIGTGDGLAHFDPATGRFTMYRHDPGDPRSLPSERVFALALDPGGGLWVGTDTGVAHLPAGGDGFAHFRLRGHADDPLRDTISSLLGDADGSIWVGSQGGLERWRLDGEHLHRLPSLDPALDTLPINVLYRDRGGIAWIGSRTLGLFRHQAGGRLLRYSHHRGERNGLADNNVNALLQDRTGTLWIGSWSAGASWVDLNSGGFERYGVDRSRPPHLSGDKVYGIADDGDGGLWLALREHGLDHVDLRNATVRNYRHDPAVPGSLGSDNVSQVAPDGRGRLWVATDAGLEVLDLGSQQFRQLPLDTGVVSSTAIYGLTVIGDFLWACTRGGLFRIDLASEQVRVYRHDPDDPDSIASDFTVTALADGRGGLWVATFGGGLDHLDLATGRFSHHRQDSGPDSISSDRVQTLMTDRAGTLWVGTANGVNRTRRHADGRLRFEAYTTHDGLAANSIGGVLQDADGGLWISTIAGISSLDPDSGEIRNYAARDGLGDGAYFVGSYLQDAQGRMYFGGVDGLSAFDPRNIRGNPVPPHTLVTDLKVFNRSVSEYRPPGLTLEGTLARAQRLELTQDLSVFTLEFSAMHFADPARNRYAYRLQGFDRDWIQTDAARPSASYTNLDPGRYVFQVKAANKDGLWEADGHRLEIVVVPPFWGTWWFRVLVLALLLAAASLVYRLRVRQLKRQAQELERRVEERTGQLEAALARLEQLSLTDPLTGMHNRRFLQQQMDAEVALCLRERGADGRDLLFFLFDIDHFKQLNDTLGHAAGDSLLCQVASRVRAVFRQSDHLVRWGGEEFLVVARGSRREQAPELAARLCRAFAAEPFVLDGGQQWSATCSTGVAAFPFVPAAPEALHWTDVVEVADLALYAAKESGRDGWVGVAADPGVDIGTLRERLQRAPRGLFDAGDLVFETGQDRARVARRIGRPHMGGAD